MALANTRDIKQYTDSLARYMPGGDLFASRNVANSRFRKLLKGLSGELFRCNGLIKEYCEQIIPDMTTKFVSEWESALGIPDDCFDGSGTLEERRFHVIIKLASLAIQTQQDLIDLAALFGINITVMNGSLHGTFPMQFPILFFNSSKDARFTIIIEFDQIIGDVFPYTFPIFFGNRIISIIQCLFEKLKPANTELIFRMIFIPPNLGNLDLWLDASDTSTITESEGLISQWNDKSGNGKNAVETSEVLKPTFVASAINGLPAINFNGSKRLTTDSIFDLSTTDFTIFIVARFDNTFGAKILLSQLFSTTILGVAINDGIFSSIDGIASIQGPNVSFIPQIYVLKLEGTTLSFITDGSTPINHNSIIPVSSTNDWVIGSTMEGLVAEIIIYDRALSSSDISLVNDYAAVKWGITLA